MLQRLSPQERRTIVIWFLAALLLRGAVIWKMAGNLQRDTDGYRQLAENICTQGVYGFGRGEKLRPTAFRPPLYPLLLTATVVDGRVRLAYVAVLQVALGALTVAGAWLAARIAGLGWGAHFAALLVAADPILLVQSTQLMTETLAAALVVLTLVALLEAARRQILLAQSSSSNKTNLTWLWVGGVLGAACLCRPTFLATTAFVICAVASSGIALGRPSAMTRWFAESPCHWSLRLRPALLVALAALPLPVAWAVRNQLALGRPIIATTHGGYTMLLGNNPDFYAHLRNSVDPQPWRSKQLDRKLGQLRAERGWNELEYDEWTSRQARRHIGEDPAGFLRSCAHRLRRLWGVLPQQLNAQESQLRQLSRYAVSAWYIAVFVLIGWGVLGRFVSSVRIDVAPLIWIWILAFAASFTALHAVYWCDMRMRAPLAAPLAIAAGIGLERILLSARRFAKKDSQSKQPHEPTGSIP